MGEYGKIDLKYSSERRIAAAWVLVGARDIRGHAQYDKEYNSE